jgi:hypothetical protein
LSNCLTTWLRRSRATLVLKSLYEEKKSNHPNTDQFLFRKLRLSAYMNQKQADSRLASSLRNKIREDAILVLGNWSCGNTKYHEPIRGIRMRRMLGHQGFQVLIVDEFGTSKHCPECHQKSLQRRSNVFTIHGHTDAKPILQSLAMGFSDVPIKNVWSPCQVMTSDGCSIAIWQLC